MHQAAASARALLAQNGLLAPLREPGPVDEVRSAALAVGGTRLPTRFQSFLKGVNFVSESGVAQALGDPGDSDPTASREESSDGGATRDIGEQLQLPPG